MATDENVSAAVLDRCAKLPIYEQLYLELKHRIRAGYYKERRFPSTHQACAEFDVSMISVKRAFKRLHQEAFISMSRGRSTMVKSVDPKPKLNSNLDALLTDINLMELTTSISTIRSERVVADEDVCVALKCEGETMVDETVRLRRLEGVPFSLVRVSAPLSISKRFRSASFEQSISSSLLRRYGIELSDVGERISACIASREVSEFLEIPDGAAVLKIVRTYCANGDNAIFCTIGFYRSDRYEYGGKRALPASWQGI